MPSNGPQLTWTNIVASLALFLTTAGGGWVLFQAQFNSISREISLADGAIKEITNKLEREIQDLKDVVEARRVEAATRQDLQNALQTTRVEFQSEIKRLDGITKDIFTHREFDVWRKENDKTLMSMEGRQNRFSEALDKMYSEVIQQRQRQ